MAADLPRDLEDFRASVVELLQGAGKVLHDRIRLARSLLPEPGSERHGVPKAEVYEGVRRAEEALEDCLRNPPWIMRQVENVHRESTDGRGSTDDTMACGSY